MRDDAPAAPTTAPAATGPRPGGRRGRTRERLLDAAFDAFAESGVEGTSVEGISERAGFTRGAFYSNFASKEEIVLAVMAREFETRLADLDARIDAVVSDARRVGLGERLPFLIRALLQSDRDDTAWAIVVSDLRLYALRNPGLARALRTEEDAYAGRLAAFMDAHATRIGVRFTVPTRELARLIDAVCTQALTDSVLAGGDHEAVAAAMADRLAMVVAAFLVPSE